MKERKYDRIRIVYYSGTGGTRMAATCLEKELTSGGALVTMQRLKAGEPQTTVGWDLLILLYAVYAFSAPPPVLAWMKTLPLGEGQAVAVLSVSGGGEMSPNTACRSKVIGTLEKKGYTVSYENMLVMPSNIALPTKSPLDKLLLQVLPEKVGHVVSELQSGQERRKSPHLFDRMLSSMGGLERAGGRWFGKRIKVSQNCTGCGICSRTCPSGNITMEGGRPSFDGRCYFCMNCLYRCPEKALSPGVGKFAVIKSGFDLDSLASAPPVSGVTAEQLESIAPGILWSGVRKYILGSQIQMNGEDEKT